MNFIILLIFISIVKEFSCFYLKFNSSCKVFLFKDFHIENILIFCFFFPKAFDEQNFTIVSITLKSIQDNQTLFPKEFSLNVSWSNINLNFSFVQSEGSSNDVITVNSKFIQKKKFLSNIHVKFRILFYHIK
jgi:hypothetical protein